MSYDIVYMWIHIKKAGTNELIYTTERITCVDYILMAVGGQRGGD